MDERRDGFLMADNPGIQERVGPPNAFGNTDLTVDQREQKRSHCRTERVLEKLQRIRMSCMIAD